MIKISPSSSSSSIESFLNKLWQRIQYLFIIPFTPKFNAFKRHRFFKVNKRVSAVFYVDKNFKNIAVKHEDNQTNIAIQIIPFQAKSIPEIWKYFQTSGSEHRNFVL
jgi:hypothetical protein